MPNIYIMLADKAMGHLFFKIPWMQSLIRNMLKLKFIPGRVKHL